jgi:hypothetical protein
LPQLVTLTRYNNCLWWLGKWCANSIRNSLRSQCSLTSGSLLCNLRCLRDCSPLNR